MQRYMPTFFKAAGIAEKWTGMKEDSENGEWYSRDDVDARILELERALKSCATAISMHIKAAENFVNFSGDALAEADKALSLMVSATK